MTAPPVIQEEAARTSSPQDQQLEAMDTRNLEGPNTGPAAVTTGPASSATAKPLPVMTPVIELQPTAFHIGEQATSSAPIVEQALRNLLSSISKENLVDILKNVLGETYNIVPVVGKQQKKKLKAKKTNEKAPTISTHMPAGATSDNPPTSQLHDMTGGMTSQPKAAAAGAEAPMLQDNGAPWVPVTYKKKGKRARGNPTAQATRGCIAKPQRNRQLEYKIRLTRSRTSIKPLIPRLKVLLNITQASATYTMYLIEKANTISVRTDSEALAAVLEKIIEVDFEGQKIPVQIFRTYGASYCKGVIYDIHTLQEDPQDEVLNLELESEKVHVVTARRLGKTNTAMLTFDGDKPPRSVLYGRRYMRVFPYMPKAVTCANCHRLGHKPDICPNATVCATCGNMHSENQVGCPTPNALFCQGCKKAGHIGTNRACPRWQETNKRMREQVKSYKEQPMLQQKRDVASREIRIPVPPSASQRWGDKVRKGLDPAAPPAEQNTYDSLKAELDRLKATVQTLQEENRQYKASIIQWKTLASNICDIKS